jgi:hypothetical protein
MAVVVQQKFSGALLDQYDEATVTFGMKVHDDNTAGYYVRGLGGSASARCQLPWAKASGYE